MLLASFVVQLFSLANPLLIQVIIDKVINAAWTHYKCSAWRWWWSPSWKGCTAHISIHRTTNRIDLRLGSEVIDHSASATELFRQASVGELGTRIAEMEKIRNCSPGATLCWMPTMVIYILVMALYSWILAIMALLVVPIQVLITVLGAPLFRHQYRQAAQCNSEPPG